MRRTAFRLILVSPQMHNVLNMCGRRRRSPQIGARHLARRPGPGPAERRGTRRLGRWAPWWWTALVLAAIGFIAVVAADMLHRLHTTRGIFPQFANPIFDAGWDRGFAEWVGYTQLAIAALALVCVALRQRRAWTHLVLAATFVWIIIDDSFELHEN